MTASGMGLFRRFFLFVFFLGGGALFPETAWYVSDPVGIALRRITRQEQGGFDYTLSVETFGNREIRRLFSKEEGETRRWERIFSSPGSVLEETTYRDGELDSVKRYYPSGLRKEEILYRNGEEDGRFLFAYAEGKPSGVVFSRPGSEERYRDEYRYYPSGEFRGLRRFYEDGKEYLSLFTYLGGIPREEWHSFGGTEILFRYDKRGSMVLQEERRGDKVTERVDFFYAPDPPYRLKERRTQDLTRNRETVLRYAADGRAEQEILFEGGERTAVTRFSYRDNLLIRKERRRRGGRDLWEYQYDEKGNMTNEYFSQNGELKHTILHNPSEDFTSVEEYYKGGSVFLRLYYRDGKEVKRELLQGAGKP